MRVRYIDYWLQGITLRTEVLAKRQNCSIEDNVVRMTGYRDPANLVKGNDGFVRNSRELLFFSCNDYTGSVTARL